MDVNEKKLVYLIRDICFAISEGNYNQIKDLEELSIEKKYPKVITDLAESFSMMLLKLEAREHELENLIKQLEKAKEKLKEQNKSLKNRIQSMEIHIDKLKQTQEVSEIVQTAFFKELKQKSKKRREK